jgi:guanine deaminase
MNAPGDDVHLERAVAIARETMERGEGLPFGAVVVKDGVALAEGANRTFASGDPTEHAELVAIRRACRAVGGLRLDGATVYASGEPCPMCVGLMYQTGIARYVFATSVEDARRIGSRSADTYAELRRPPADRSVRGEHRPMPAALALFDAHLARAAGR